MAHPELTVTDIKQYFYCPRIVYFTHVMPVARRPTAKMAYGKEEHLRLDALEKRRRLVRYGLAEGERRFHVFLYSERWNLNGLLDLLIVTPAGYFPVEFKYTSRRPGLNHVYQLLAYAMLVEEAYGRPVREGFIYRVSDAPQAGQEVMPVPFSQGRRDFLRRTLDKMAAMIAGERMPPRSLQACRCRDCEWRNYCGDL